MRDGVLDSLSGLGTGKLRDSFDAIVKGGGRFYLSGMSSNARGISENDLKGKSAQFATPSVLLRLAKEHAVTVNAAEPMPRRGVEWRAPIELRS
jgi:uncharacterized protein